MKDQEILGLMEAYSSMYVPQELTEEVEIAAQYFYEMGLNEDGVDILIEELGVEEFASFVYDIAEDYCLTEARSGGVKIEPKLASGKAIEGKPKAASLKRLRGQKEARKEAEEKASESKPSGMKASLQRQSAVAAAAKKQPKKPGFLDRVASAVNAGIERHNAANKSLSKAASETGKTLSKVGKAASTVAKGVTSGISGTAKLAGHVAKKGLSEEVEAWVNQLVEEGYDLSEYNWDDMTEIYIAEVKGIEGHINPNTGQSSYGLDSGLAMTPRKRMETRANALQKRGEGKRANKIRAVMKRPSMDESFDIYDVILSHLLDEGYADTEQAAEAIMVNMSEEWREDIMEKTAMSKRGLDEPTIRNTIAKNTGGGESADRASALEKQSTYDPKTDQQRQNYARAQRGDHRKTTSSSPGLRGYGHQSSDPAVKAKQAARGAQRGSAALTPNEKKKLNR